MPNPASSYQTMVGVQPTPNLALTGNQQSNMASQLQGMMVQYPPMPSYQVHWWWRIRLLPHPPKKIQCLHSTPVFQIKVAQKRFYFFLQHVSVPQQSYQQPVFVSCQPGQGPVAVSGVQPCYSLLPPTQHTTMRYVSTPRSSPLEPHPNRLCVDEGQSEKRCTLSLIPVFVFR